MIPQQQREDGRWECVLKGNLRTENKRRAVKDDKSCFPSCEEEMSAGKLGETGSLGKIEIEKRGKEFGSKEPMEGK